VAEEVAVAIEPPTIRFLVVDEDRAACEQMKEFLEREGFEVRAVTDPTTVEAEVRRADLHVLVLELEMKQLSGLETIKRVRKIDTDLAIIIYTSHPSFESAQEAIRYAIDAYVTKPFREEDFRHLLAEVIAKKGLTRTPEDQLHRVIGNIIRDLRRDKDLTLKDMSRRTGLSVSLLSQIERAESSASISSLYTIAKGLNTRIGSLFGDN
jgi:DNA-binding NtrC family response regulator